MQTVTTADVSRAIDTMVLGFNADPFMRWLYPDAQSYLRNFGPTIRFFAGQGFDQNTAFMSADAQASSVWLPPGAHPDEEGLGTLFEQQVDAAKHDDLFAVFEQMDKFHPKDPCWHLAFIAVDPASCGKGLGSALLQHNLKLCDADKTLAYLENTNPANTAFYQRHGFEVVAELQSGMSPPMFAMAREPR